MKARDAEADPECDDAHVIRRARIALAATCEPGEPGLVDVVDAQGPTRTIAALLSGNRALQVPRAEAIGARLAELDLDAVESRASDLGAQVLLPGDAQWPARVDDLGPTRPLALWCWGQANVRLHSVRSVAMVGARACTRYGEQVAREWSAQLAQDGIAIISGGAYGIDAAAHRGALAVDGTTICLLACGVDVAYPRGHESLFAEIVESGVLVSEAPPGERVRRRRFLTRNRLIAALASATCVVEAAWRSGSASTAAHAAEMDRVVLAVPGPVTSEASQGTHRLISDRVAIVAADVKDVRQAIDPLSLFVDDRDRADAVSPQMREVLDALPGEMSGHRGLTQAQVATRSGVAATRVQSLLAHAQEMGVARSTHDGYWVYAPGASRSRSVRDLDSMER